MWQYSCSSLSDETYLLKKNSTCLIRLQVTSQPSKDRTRRRCTAQVSSRSARGVACEMRCVVFQRQRSKDRHLSRGQCWSLSKETSSVIEFEHAKLRRSKNQKRRQLL